jgi:hypothetical protein
MMCSMASRERLVCRNRWSLGVMKDEQPFSILVDRDRLLSSARISSCLVPIRIAKRGGFDAKVDLSFYGLPAEVDAPAVAIEPGQDRVMARVYFKEGAPPSTSTILVQGTSAVPYRRNPWQADRAKVKVTEAEAALAARQVDVTNADAGLKAAQAMVVTLTEQVQKISEELAVYSAQQQKLRDEFANAVNEQKSSIEALAKVQTQLASVKTGSSSTPEQLTAAIQAVREAAAAADEAAKKLETVSASAGELAKQVVAAKEMEVAKNQEKTAAEEQVATRTKEVETTQAALAAAQKEVETATAAKTAADAALKAAEEASKPNPVNVRAISEPMVITIHPSPAKLAAALPDAGAVKRGSMVPVQVTVTRKNAFAGPLKLSLVVPDGVTGLTAEPVDVAADQAAGTLTISVAADAAAGDIANVVIRATGDVGGRAASTDVPVAVKVVE